MALERAITAVRTAWPEHAWPTDDAMLLSDAVSAQTSLILHGHDSFAKRADDLTSPSTVVFEGEEQRQGNGFGAGERDDVGFACAARQDSPPDDWEEEDEREEDEMSMSLNDDDNRGVAMFMHSAEHDDRMAESGASAHADEDAHDSKLPLAPPPEEFFLSEVPPSVVRERSARLVEDQIMRESDSVYQTMQRIRARLPAHAMRDEIVATVRRHAVVVVSGETGCGKTTQVPQFILDDAISRGVGGACSIICTQPRRISAIGVAERVAAERAQRLGEQVGYQIRLDRVTSDSTQLLFCTTGILLRRMQHDPALRDVSHVIIDEVHERSIDSDFLMIILRDLQASKRPDLRIVRAPFRNL